jgi:hypothetical protein
MDALNQHLSPGLARGQLWKTSDSYVRIIDRGKTLVHYKLMKNPTQSAVTRLMKRNALAHYLQAAHASLLSETGARGCEVRPELLADLDARPVSRHFAAGPLPASS